MAIATLKKLKGPSHDLGNASLSEREECSATCGFGYGHPKDRPRPRANPGQGVDSYEAENLSQRRSSAMG